MSWVVLAIIVALVVFVLALAVCELFGLGPFDCTGERNCICGDCVHTYECSACGWRTAGCEHGDEFASAWEVDYQ